MTACTSIYKLSLSQNSAVTPNSTIAAQPEAAWAAFNQGFRRYCFG